jgi:hypothetical protein
MEIKLNVEAKDLEHKMDEFLDKMTPDQVKEVTKELLTPYFKDFKLSMTQAGIELKIEQLRKEGVDSWRLNDKRKEFEKERVTIYEEIIKACVEETRVQVRKVVEEDEEYKVAIQTAIASIKKDLPAFINSALTQVIASNFANLFTGMAGAQETISNQYQALNDIRQKLSQHGIYT